VIAPIQSPPTSSPQTSSGSSRVAKSHVSADVAAPGSRTTNSAAATQVAAPGAAARRKDLRRNLSSSLVDGSSFSIMVGCGETYFSAFALALGLSQVSSGLVATLPLLVGSLLQLASPHLLKRVGSYRRWIVACVCIQAAVFVPLVIMAVDRRVPAALVFLFTSIYWGAGLATGPAWNTWIGTLVPVPIRARFFAWRTRLVQLGTLLGFVAAGITLQYGKSQNATLIAFAALFAAAGFSRFVSALALARKTEPVAPSHADRHVSLREFASRIGRTPDGKFLLYLMVVQAAVQLSGPYFTPYMLKQMKLDYVSYTILVASAFAAKMLSLPWLGHLAHRYGPRKLLLWGSLGIMPLSAMWLVSNNFAFLIVLQVAGGIAWAGYELAWFLLFFEMLPKEERTSVLTTFNFGHSLASVVGSILGGAILLTFGEYRNVYLSIFAASAVLRFLTFKLLRPRFAAPQPPAAAAPRPMRPTMSINIAAASPHAAASPQAIAAGLARPAQPSAPSLGATLLSPEGRDIEPRAR
jgi:MFS family permease